MSTQSPVINVLLVDDDAELIELVKTALERDGHAVTSVQTVAAATRSVEAGQIDVVVLDVDLLDGAALGFCRKARASRLTAPILMLAANAGVDARVACLDAGADDFLAKPFAIAELRARVRALARRMISPPAQAWTWTHGTATIDFPKRRATVAGQPVQFTAREWCILLLLASARGQVVPRTRILQEVWASVGEPASASLDVLMTRIRKKLGSDAVRTLRGEGYALS